MILFVSIFYIISIFVVAFTTVMFKIPLLEARQSQLIGSSDRCWDLIYPLLLRFHLSLSMQIKYDQELSLVSYNECPAPKQWSTNDQM